MKADAGAYVLQLELRKPARITIGALGARQLERGTYFYVGSARRGIAARVARHERLANAKSGIAHWHIDYILLHPHCRLARVDFLPGAGECRVSRSIRRRNGVTIPVPGFGSTDCRSGCRAHLFFQARTRPAI
jgi:Uri superfamily endonuclease